MTTELSIRLSDDRRVEIRRRLLALRAFHEATASYRDALNAALTGHAVAVTARDKMHAGWRAVEHDLRVLLVKALDRDAAELIRCPRDLHSRKPYVNDEWLTSIEGVDAALRLLDPEEPAASVAEVA